MQKKRCLKVNSNVIVETNVGYKEKNSNNEEQEQEEENKKSKYYQLISLPKGFKSQPTYLIKLAFKLY